MTAAVSSPSLDRTMIQCGYFRIQGGLVYNTVTLYVYVIRVMCKLVR